MKTCVTSLLGLLALLVGGASAHAQYPYARPTVTPYLNLYRSGASPILNYQTLVRPELDFRSSITSLQQQNRANQQGITDLQTNPGPLVTGHQAGFMTQGSYFQTLAAGGTGAVGTGTSVSSFGTTVGRPATSPRPVPRFAGQ
jgi:hypothetical protein